ncbi:glycosyltransferase family 4 protein [Schizophyllum commune H4-8]|uniref:glycosyltransferase family 4 protein n=1 Tax=Schizophyllum commune (strain H4-8 / FGSC 9210) TaxID=578458 RepID=UPI002160EDCA|nr:glycosyltransferase family 4 protein [Schizophyllum commune H4-8]KAI5896247.1 glycosyltransferase family 4 protein [Schizophyllum commune H4-8]
MAFKFWDRYRRTKFLEPFNRHPTDGHTKIIGFFHPYCNAGGGGERVLWTAVAAMQRSNPNLVCAIYSGDTDATKDDIIAKVQSRFAITLDSRALGFVFLQSRYLVEDTTWPRFTLLGQSVGSMLLALEAMLYLRPDLYIDTMGYAFTYPIFKIFGGVTCGAYVHYPTISTDMLARVESRRNWHTNSSWISSSPILTQGKLLYYRIFMHFYAVSLRQASFVMANSTWTKNHVDSILKHNDRFMSILLFPFFLTLALLPGSRKSTAADYALRVYPPCDTTEMAKYPLEGREPIIISVAQFRPEKDHPAQLRALYELFDAHPEYRETVRLILIGGSRNAEDAARVELLRTLAAKLGIQDSIEFRINAPYPDMLEMLGRSSIGLSTMVDEHFGINVVEYMAAGVIPLAHASAGPLLDIVTPWEGQPTGFHATTPQEYAEKLHHILTLPPDEDLAMRERARTAALSRFSEAEFVRRWDMSGWQKWLEAE